MNLFASLLVALFLVSFFSAEVNGQNNATVVVYASNEYNKGNCYQPTGWISYTLTSGQPSRFWGNAYMTATYMQANATIDFMCLQGASGNCTRYTDSEVADWKPSMALSYWPECVVMYYASFYQYVDSCYSEWICTQAPTGASVTQVSEEDFAANSAKHAALRASFN